MVILHRTASPLNPETRRLININWGLIEEGFTGIKQQIAFMTGVDNLEQVIEQLTATMEQVGALQASYESELQNLTTEKNELIESSSRDLTNQLNVLGNQAEEELTQHVMTLQETIAQTLTDLENAISQAEATNLDATETINQVNEAAQAIQGWGTATPWDVSAQYEVNNVVTFNGSTWQAKRDNTGVQPVAGEDWILLAQRGIDGEGSVKSVNGMSPDEEGNVTIDVGGKVKTVNNVEPDAAGNVELTFATTKEDVGLGNVDNTADIDKPVSKQQEQAIETMYLNANNYTDEQIAAIGSGNAPKLVTYEHLVFATENEQKVFTFTDAVFDKANDTVLVWLGGEALNKDEYTIAKGEEGAVNVTVLEPWVTTGTVMRIVVFRNVPVGPDGAIDAAVLKDGTITQPKLHADLLNYLAKQSEITRIDGVINELQSATDDFETHIGNNAIHVTTQEKTSWNGAVSDVSELQTQVTTLNDDMSSLFTSVSNGKAAIANAITEKGVTTAADAEFATMAANIAAIETSGGGSGGAAVTYLTGQVTAPATTTVFQNEANANSSQYYVAIPTTAFNGAYPRLIKVKPRIMDATADVVTFFDSNMAYYNGSQFATILFANLKFRTKTDANYYYLPVKKASVLYEWEAWFHAE